MNTVYRGRRCTQPLNEWGAQCRLQYQTIKASSMIDKVFYRSQLGRHAATGSGHLFEMPAFAQSEANMFANNSPTDL
jgi:hypothetical protein